MVRDLLADDGADRQHARSRLRAIDVHGAGTDCAIPQPYLVPVSPICSRIAHSSGVFGSASTFRVLC